MESRFKHETLSASPRAASKSILRQGLEELSMVMPAVKASNPSAASFLVISGLVKSAVGGASWVGKALMQIR